MRLLIVGDSTAVGTGASSPASSLAGLLAEQYPRLWIDNRARDGAKFADVLQQLSGPERFDMVLVQAGGNDVIRMRGMDALREDIERVVDAVYVKLFHERENDPFVADRSLNARDGLHPSDKGYRSWWQALREQAGLDTRLAAARAG